MAPRASLFLAAAAVLVAAAAAAGPAVPAQYSATAAITLPYLGWNETVTTQYDAVNQLQRNSFDSGQDTYIYRVGDAVEYEVVPLYNVLACYVLNGSTAITSIIPDATNFTMQSNNVIINGQCTQHWQYIVTVDTRVNTYDYYVSCQGGLPVRYHMLGFDSLLGSHYDEYVVDYSNVNIGAGSVNQSMFVKPNMNCGAEPNPGVPGHAAMTRATMAVLSQLFSTPRQFASPHSEADKKFDELAMQFGRNYATKADEAAARKAFYVNNMKATLVNRKRIHGVMAMNKFFDWTESDMARMRAPKRTRPVDNGAHAVHLPPVDKASLPTSVDWRQKGAVSIVKDQGICGSCWSFGTVGTIEGSVFLATGKMNLLSEQELIDCSWNEGNDGCDGGEDFRAYRWILQNGGLATAATYGRYEMQDAWCHPADKTVQNGAVLKGYVNVTSGDESALMDALANHGPVSISIDASHWSFSYYASGVYYEPACGNGPNDLDHTVLAVGYGTSADGQDYWIVKNSWSTHWGDDGYVMMSRQNNNCGVATAATYVFVQ